jgi:hypothetical protein
VLEKGAVIEHGDPRVLLADASSLLSGTYVHTYTHTHTHTHTHTQTYIHTFIHVKFCVCICIYIYTYIYICTGLCRQGGLDASQILAAANSNSRQKATET